MPTTCIFLRHAQGTHNVNSFKKLNQYNDPVYIDAELTNEGVQQTIQIRQQFQDIQFDAIFCSPLRRCRSTLVGVLPKSIDFPVQVDDRLIEQPTHNNICNKRFEKDILQQTCPKLWNLENVSETNPFRETTEEEDRKKMQEFTKYVRATYPDSTILIVSHWEWINRWMKMYQLKHTSLDNCEYVTVTL